MLRKFLNLALLGVMLILSTSASAMLSMELTRGIAGAIPIAITPFAGGEYGENITAVISNDLQNSGRFKVFGRNSLTMSPSNVDQVQFDYFRRLGADDLVVGNVRSTGNGRYDVSFQLLDVLNSKGAAPDSSVLVEKTYRNVSAQELRALAHHISDEIYLQLTGVRGVFSTKLAYVVVQRGSNGNARYMLEVSDQDGYNPQPLLSSTDPIMSPSWSPDGRKLAYVSFENRRAAIYIQDLRTGSRHLLSKFNGINGAPAWSPNGRKMALVLSKDGSPNIYVMDLASQNLTQYTRDSYINTEPAWSPDGKNLMFTSNRGGNPQIYQINMRNGQTSRISYDGDYNARASFTKDGNHVAFIHRESGAYHIAVQDLDTGTLRNLTTTGRDNDSPSMAPNGSMVLFDTIYNGRSVLGMVSTDGRVQLHLPARNGEAQDPAWSPFLS